MLADSSTIEAPDKKSNAGLRRLTLLSKRLASSDVLGCYKSAFHGSGLLFAELKQYSPGDDVRHIHWRASARSSNVFLKTYQDERTLNILFAVDCSASTRACFGKANSERALELVALLSQLAAHNNDKTGLLTFDSEIRKFIPCRAARPAQVHNILRSIEQIEQSAQGTDIAVALQQIKKQQSKRSLIFLISDFYGNNFLHELKTLNIKHDVIAICLQDNHEIMLPNAGLIRVRDAETGALCLLDTSSKSVRSNFARQAAQRLSQLERDFQSIGCDFISLSDDPVAPLLQLMRKRTRRVR